MMRRRLLTLLLLASAGITMVTAQPSAFTAEVQSLAVMLHEPQALMLVDSQLLVATPFLTMQAERRDGHVVGLQPDTTISTLDNEVHYAVRRPQTDELYYLASDKKGNRLLHCGYWNGKKWRSKKVSMGMEVDHPTFSADGRIMVFASRDGAHNRGGYDLWYSQFDDGEWQRPVSLGDRINTEGHEVSPTVVGDRLFFSSTGRTESKGRLQIYSTQLIASDVVGDTVGMLQIGRSPVQHLPEPFNRQGINCFGLTADESTGCYYWFVGQTLMANATPLLSGQLWGFVGDESGHPLAGASVEAYTEGRLAGSATAANSGYYYLVLPADSLFHIVISAEGHYREQFDVRMNPDSKGLLIGQMRRDVTLGSLPVGRAIPYADLFESGASVELSSFGRQQLDRLVAFLLDNPSFGISLHLKCHVLDDSEFNQLVAERRMQTLTDYLRLFLPPSTPIIASASASEGSVMGSQLSVIVQ